MRALDQMKRDGRGRRRQARRAREPGRWRLVGALGAATVLLLAALLVLTIVMSSEHGQAGPGATVDEIVEYPTSWDGRSVTIAAPVDDILSARAFTLSDEDLFFGEELLVISRNPVPRLENPGAESIVQGDRVQVSGVVDHLRVLDVQDRLGADLDDALLDDWEGQPVVIADTVTITPGLPDQRAATIDDILDQPSAFYGRSVTVRGPVDEVVGPRVLTLSDGDALFSEELLILSTDQLADLAVPEAQAPIEAQWAQATGTVRRFAIADAERELGLDLNDDLFTAWEGRTALVASCLRMMGSDDVAARAVIEPEAGSCPTASSVPGSAARESHDAQHPGHP